MTYIPRIAIERTRCDKDHLAAILRARKERGMDEGFAVETPRYCAGGAR